MTESANAPQVNTTESVKKESGAEPNNEEKRKNPSRSHALGWFTLFLSVAGVSAYLYWTFYSQYHETTDDAYANGNYINVNPVISGAVTAYYADDTNLVQEGQLLVQLDPTNYQAIYDKELAKLAQITLNVKQLYNNVHTQIAEVKNQRIVLERMLFNYNNRLKLKETNPEAVSEEDYVHSQQYFLEAQFQLQQAEAKFSAALALTGNTLPKNHPLIEQQKAIILTAYYNLSHCAIYASQTGYIAQRFVDTGQWVTPTTNLMAIIPTHYVWVDANFKETQLGKMRIGQPAKVWFDLYGSDVIFNGKVIGIGSGTGSVFSLIPPQNATGNWIKIVQRLPVRISLDKETLEKYPIRLGISAEVDVDITNQDLPRLAMKPAEKTVGKTSIFNIHLDKVNEIMNKIVDENLIIDETKTKKIFDELQNPFSSELNHPRKSS